MNEQIRFFAPASTQIDAVGKAIWETPNIEHPTPNIEAERLAHGPADGVHACATFDAVKASQARSSLIKASIIFFGLDGDCPSLSDNLTT